MVFLTLLFMILLLHDMLVMQFSGNSLIRYQGNNEKDGILGNEAVMTEDMWTNLLNQKGLQPILTRQDIELRSTITTNSEACWGRKINGLNCSCWNLKLELMARSTSMFKEQGSNNITVSLMTSIWTRALQQWDFLEKEKKTNKHRRRLAWCGCHYSTTHGVDAGC